MSTVPTPDLGTSWPSEERLKLAAEGTGIGFFEADLQTRLIVLDDMAAHIFDLAPGKLATFEQFRERIHPADIERMLAQFNAVKSNGGTHAADYRVSKSSGATCWTHITTRVRLDAVGAITHLLITAQDISQRHRTEAELREVEQRFRLLVENLEDVFWIMAWPDRRLRYVSPGYLRSWGFNEDELLGGQAYWTDKIHPDDIAEVERRLDSFDDAAPASDHLAVEYRIVLDDGRVRWIRDRGVAVRNAAGTIDRVIGIAEDITDRRTVIRTLREREQRLQLAVDAAELHVWTLHTTTRRLDLSDALCAMFGLPPVACRRLGPWRRRFVAEDRARIEAALRRLAITGDPLHEQFRVRRGDGTVTWLDTRAIRIVDDDGRGAQIHGVCMDVTERHQFEQQLRDSERDLRMITSAVPIGITRVDRGFKYLFVNESYATQILSTAPRHLIGQNMSDALGAAVFTVIKPHLERALAGKVVDFEVPVPLPRGYRYVHATYIPEIDEDNRVVGVVSVVEDVTERKVAEVKLYEREREFKTLADNAPDIIARVDRDLRYLYLNRAAEAAFGVVRERFAGRKAAELGFPDEYVNATSAAVAHALGSGVEHSISFSMGEQAGELHFIARAVPEFDRLGLIESVLLIVYDVSERVRAQAQRDALLASEHEARELAEAAARGRDEFLAIVSHELRSPLNGIQSWAHVLESTLSETTPPIARRALAGIRTGIEQQVRLIDDLLDATRIMSGKLSLTLSPLRIRPAVEQALDSVAAKARDKEITIQTSYRLDDETVDGDVDRLQQIVWNLLSNAIKFTPRGGHVWLELKRDGRYAVLTVRDDSRGIDKAFLPHLFERFQRDETGNTRGQDGLGLGLMLVRHLCELHRGSVSAASEGAGQGTCVTVTLPLHGVAREAEAPDPQPAAGAAALPSLEGLRLLMVDDHEESRDALATLLAQAGAVVDVLSSGEDAVRWLSGHDKVPLPDLLVCDIAMPGQDGYETIRQIRAHEQLEGSSRLPAIALTAFAQNDDRVRALTAGFEIHISKPVAIEELIVTIAAFARHHPPIEHPD